MCREGVAMSRETLLQWLSVFVAYRLLTHPAPSGDMDGDELLDVIGVPSGDPNRRIVHSDVLDDAKLLINVGQSFLEKNSDTRQKSGGFAGVHDLPSPTSQANTLCNLLVGTQLSCTQFPTPARLHKQRPEMSHRGTTM
jgi:hypothetical protein